MRQTIQELVEQGIAALIAQGVLPPATALAVKIERPREKDHGDFSTNAALMLAKPAGKPPRALAEALMGAIPREEGGLIQRMAVAGPGFLNFFVNPSHLRQLVTEIRRQGPAYGRSQRFRGRRAQIEFVSANPTGPMHVGHGRGAVTGDALASLLAAVGWEVEREYYINDAGAQVKVLGRSALIRYLGLLGEAAELPPECYPGEYVIDLAQALLDRDGDQWREQARTVAAGTAEPPREVVDFAIEAMLAMIRDDLDKLRIHFDSWVSERQELHEKGAIDQALRVLTDRGHLYQGVLEPPKGKLPDDWEPRPQLLFRATAFGDEIDRPLQKSSGEYTYFAADIAYHWLKVKRGFDSLVNVWGADHGGYVKRVQAAIEALTGKKDLLDVKLIQMVNLTRGGKPVRMSKRAGTFVTLREVVDETGADAVRFWFLTREAGSRLDFDLDLAQSRSNDNPVYYVQYAHARIHSVRAKMAEQGLVYSDEGLYAADLERLTEEAELDLIRRLELFPEVVEAAALMHEPHRVPYYLLELAAVFHAYYHGHRILDEDSALRDARLALCDACRQVFFNGLKVLGVSAPEQM